MSCPVDSHGRGSAWYHGDLAPPLRSSARSTLHRGVEAPVRCQTPASKGRPPLITGTESLEMTSSFLPPMGLHLLQAEGHPHGPITTALFSKFQPQSLQLARTAVTGITSVGQKAGNSVHLLCPFYSPNFPRHRELGGGCSQEGEMAGARRGKENCALFQTGPVLQTSVWKVKSHKY